ncbi:hypothetical protein ENTCAN_05059 [Enterobacter cancerogenus ATCC 35316]|nr:hypothetical protein ENTCAN_05059 [Enterobacter cancerogenus ATCC 35316]
MLSSRLSTLRQKLATRVKMVHLVVCFVMKKAANHSSAQRI